MGTQAKSKIPTIELSEEKLKVGSEEWVLIGKEIRVALEEFGCFLVVYEKVSLELHNSIFEATKELFHLPIETRIQNTSEKPYHGYFGRYSFLPLYESMAVDNPTSLQAIQTFTNLMWPAGNKTFCETVHDFSTLVAKLEETVTRMVLESYGVSKQVCESSIESTTHLLRCFKYRVPKQDETDLGLHSHTDLTFLSILHQHLIGGLQVKSLDNNNDGEWIDIDPVGRSSFIVMAGDALMAWSNDRIRGCRHRVMMRGDETRYSLGLFSFKSGTISVPEELVEDNHPLKYKPFDHFEFLRYDKANASHKTCSRIKDYCGI